MKEAVKSRGSKIQVNTILDLADKNTKKWGKLQTFDLSYFTGNNFFGDNGSQNCLVFQPPSSILQYLLVVM